MTADPIRKIIDDLSYVRNLRQENDDLRRQLKAYQALIEPPPPPAEAGPIARRWQDVRWRAQIARDGAYLVSAILYDDTDGYALLHLDEPSRAEAATIQLLEQAPGDIRVLLDVLAAYERLQKVGRTLIDRWADSREPTPFDLELAALSVQLRQERRTLLARGIGELFEDDPPRGAA